MNFEDYLYIKRYVLVRSHWYHISLALKIWHQSSSRIWCPFASNANLTFADNRLWRYRGTPLHYAWPAKLGSVANSYLGVLISLCFIVGCWAGGFLIKGHMKACCKGAMVRPACADVWRGRKWLKDRLNPEPAGLSQWASPSQPGSQWQDTRCATLKCVCTSMHHQFSVCVISVVWTYNTQTTFIDASITRNLSFTEIMFMLHTDGLALCLCIADFEVNCPLCITPQPNCH